MATEELLLKRAALDTIRGLKLRHIELIIKEKQKELKIAEENKNDSDVQIIVNELRNMEEAKKSFSALLGRVVIR